MLTAVRSRMRAALTPLPALLIGFLVIAALVVALLRFFPDQGGMHTYQSYQLEVSPALPWHLGQPLTLSWMPTSAGLSVGEPPRSVTCHFWLYGPYTTRSLAEAYQPELTSGVPDDSGGTAVGGTMPAAGAPPLALSTDRGAAAPAPVAYALPDALAPGYYVAASFVDNAGTSWVAEVAAT